MFSVIKISEQLRNENFRAFEVIVTFVIKNSLLLPEAHRANAQRANVCEKGFTLDKITFKLTFHSMCMAQNFASIHFDEIGCYSSELNCSFIAVLLVSS